MRCWALRVSGWRQVRVGERPPGDGFGVLDIGLGSPAGVYSRPMPTIATATRVDGAALLDFTRTRHRMTLITWRRDGRPQVSPVTGGVDAQGRIVISTYPDRAKAV